MLVPQRMQALGDHAKGSRQPPLRPRQATNGDAITTAKQAIMRESAPKPPVVDDAAVKAVLNETGNDSAAEPAIIHESAAPPSIVDDTAAKQIVVHETGDDGTAKRAIIHEWENWSALHTDELGDPSAAIYFFNHLQAKKLALLNFPSDDKCQTVRGWLLAEGRFRG